VLQVPVNINGLVVSDLISGHAGRGRRGSRAKLLCFHIQAGRGNPKNWFISLDNGPSNNRADCTIWNPRLDGEKLHQFLFYTDGPWTNGAYNKPNMALVTVADLYRRGVYPNDVCLTIEHEANEGEGFTEAQIQRTARIAAFWCEQFDIVPSRETFLRHSDFDSVSRPNCPGPKFPLERIIQMAQDILSNEAGLNFVNTAGTGGGQGGPVPAGADPNARLFKETGFWVVNTLPDGTPINFYNYWQRIGLSQLGYPIGPAYFDNEFSRIVQWTERGRMEYHPENDATEFKVQEGLTGRECVELRRQVADLKAQLAGLKN
jgi:hypothetical protein